jgi:UDPglucose 6-dehydrogenase
VGPEHLQGMGAVAFEADLADAVRNADAIVIITRWDDYLKLPELVAGLDPPPLVVDGRRMLDKTSVPWYTGIGL